MAVMIIASLRGRCKWYKSSIKMMCVICPHWGRAVYLR